MITAKKIPWFCNIFAMVVRRMLKKSFHQCYIRKENEILPGGPVLFIANHSSWWDGLISYMLDYSQLHKNSYFMMSLEGMQRFPYFRYLGAFSVEKGNMRSVLASLKYAETLLQGKGSVWIFPQGEEKHQDIRPLGFQSGVLKVIEQNPTIPIVSVTYCYSFGHAQKPELYLSIGEAMKYGQLEGQTRKERLQHLEQKVTEQLNQLKEDVIDEQKEKFHILSW